MSELDGYRKKIDEIDRKITRLFEERMDTVIKVGEYKKKNNLPVLNKDREKQVIEKNIGYLNNKDYSEELVVFFNNLMNIAKELEHKKMKNKYEKYSLKEIKAHRKDKCSVGYFGVPGSYTEEAMINHFGNDVDSKSYDEFEDVFMAIKNDKIDYGVVPIENSSTGAISKVYDLLYKYDFYIVGEECLKIEEHLLGVEGTSLDDIKEVYSHEEPFKQSTEFLKKYKEWKLIPFHSTSVSAKLVSDLKDKSKAAIASRRSAQIYGLSIIEENINNRSENTTRFIIISKRFESDKNCNKISVVFSMEHKAGALYELVRHLAENQINMMKIESRPMQSGVWKYFLYVDFEGNVSDEKVKNALNKIEQNSSYFKLIGGYQKA
ncbi:MAG: prephenate dehydratase [Clostridium butyricum]|nr:prephenate dehydratase [Clostridium butyricum]